METVDHRPPGFTNASRLQIGTKMMMYSGTLISDLLDLVEQAERSSGWRGPARAGLACTRELNECAYRKRNSEPEKFPQTPGLSAADRNLCLFLVVHPQLVGTLKPGHNLADAVNIHEVRAMSAPE